MGKEKRRKKIQRELARKPRFRTIFAKNFFVLMMVAVLIGAVGIYVARTIYISECRNRINILLEDGQSKLVESNREARESMMSYTLSGDDEAVSEYRQGVVDAMRYRLNYRVDRLCTENEKEEGCLAVYYGEELVADSLETIYSLGATDVDEAPVLDDRFYSEIYELDVTRIEKAYPGLIDEIMDRVETLNREAGTEVYYATYGQAELYFGNGVFVPKYIEIVGRAMTDEEENTSVARYDLERVDTSGYLYQTTYPGILVTCLYRLGCEEEGIQGFYYRQSIKTVYDAKEKWDETLWGVDCMTHKDVELGNEDFTIVATGSYNLFREHGKLIVYVYASMLLLAVLIACIVSYNMYLRKQTRYEMETYRRNTTNAMAHDLKSPLMAISAYAENLVNGANPEKNEYYGESILDTVKYMDQVIANILNLSKIENGSLRLDKEPVELVPLMQEHVAKYDLVMKEKNVKFSINGECELLCDRLWMTQMIDNLLSNGVKYAKDNSVVGVQLTKDSLTIMNQFEGELDKSPEELMESFVKGDNARSDSKGTGIGLAIVKNVAQAHGYDVKIQIENNVFIVKVIF